jgi:hypothetical protein
MIAAVAFALQAIATTFAPPLDAPIRVVSTATRSENNAGTSFTSTRSVTFRRDGTGYRAEVTLDRAEGGPADEPNAMFRIGLSGLAGRTTGFRLDGAGKLLAVDDREAIWNRLCDGIAAMAGANQQRAQAIAAMVAQLRVLPAEQQQAMLATLLAPILATDVAGLAAGTQPVRLPARAPSGAAAMLEGTRTVAAEGSLVRIDMAAQGDVAAPAGAAKMAITILRLVDPATGLARNSRETVETRLETPAGPRVMVSETMIRVELPRGLQP